MNFRQTSEDCSSLTLRHGVVGEPNEGQLRGDGGHHEVCHYEDTIFATVYKLRESTVGDGKLSRGTVDGSWETETVREEDEHEGRRKNV